MYKLKQEIFFHLPSCSTANKSDNKKGKFDKKESIPMNYKSIDIHLNKNIFYKIGNLIQEKSFQELEIKVHILK